MLYDKKWDKQIETKADPFKVESLIAWLERQPQDKTYCYTDNGGCLLFQYFQFAGLKPTWVGGVTWISRDSLHEQTPLSEDFRWISRGEPRTFGDALRRARTLTD